MARKPPSPAAKRKTGAKSKTGGSTKRKAAPKMGRAGAGKGAGGAEQVRRAAQRVKAKAAQPPPKAPSAPRIRDFRAEHARRRELERQRAAAEGRPYSGKRARGHKEVSEYQQRKASRHERMFQYAVNQAARSDRPDRLYDILARLHERVAEEGPRWFQMLERRQAQLHAEYLRLGRPKAPKSMLGAERFMEMAEEFGLDEDDSDLLHYH